jgi:hypothetical protein
MLCLPRFIRRGVVDDSIPAERITAERQPVWLGDGIDCNAKQPVRQYLTGTQPT